MLYNAKIDNEWTNPTVFIMGIIHLQLLRISYNHYRRRANIYKPLRLISTNGCKKICCLCLRACPAKVNTGIISLYTCNPEVTLTNVYKATRACKHLPRGNVFTSKRREKQFSLSINRIKLSCHKFGTDCTICKIGIETPQNCKIT